MKMKNVNNIIVRFARDCAVATVALIATKATEAGAKEGYKKAIELKEKYWNKNPKTLSSYEGVLSEKETP